MIHIVIQLDPNVARRLEGLANAQGKTRDELIGEVLASFARGSGQAGMPGTDAGQSGRSDVSARSEELPRDAADTDDRRSDQTDDIVHQSLGTVKPLPKDIKERVAAVWGKPGVVFVYYCRTCHQTRGAGEQQQQAMIEKGLVRRGLRFAAMDKCPDCLADDR